MEQYEFSEDENKLMQDLSKKMSFLGIFMVTLGTLYGAGAVFGAVTFTRMTAALGPVSGTQSGGLIFIVMFTLTCAVFLGSGLWMSRGAQCFKEIAETEGSDVDRLMDALQELKKLYRLWAVLLGLGVLGAIGSIVMRFLQP